MPIGILSIHIYLPGCSSLKEKRSRIKPLITKLRRDYNLSVAEMDYHDVWQSAEIACVVISNKGPFTQQVLQKVLTFVEEYWRDVDVIDHQIEII